MLRAQAFTWPVRIETDWRRLLGQLSRILCFLFMVAASFHLGSRVFVRPEWSTDKMLQAAATENYVKGNGLGYWAVAPDDLGNPRLYSLYQWPAGYTFLLGPIFWLTQDINVAGLIGDWLGIAILFGSWWTILNYLGKVLGDGGRLILWCLWASTLAPLLGTSTGLLALAFYSLGLALTLRLVHRSQGFGWLGGLSGLCVGIGAWIRYAFWPLGLVLPLTLAYAAWRGDRRFWRAAIFNGLTFALALLALVRFQKHETGSANFLSVYYGQETRQGFWPEQLLKTAPFPAHVFRIDDALTQRFHDMDRPWLQGMKWAISGLVLVIFALETIRACRRENDFKPSTRESDEDRSAAAQARVHAVFYVAAALTAVVTVGMLAALTVRHCNPAIDRWTYVQEMRYYTPVLMFVSVALLTWTFRAGPVDTKALLRMGLMALLLYFPMRLYAQPKYAFNTWTSPIRTGAPADLYFGRQLGAFARALDEAKEGAERVAFIEDPKVCVSGQKYALAALKGISYTHHHVEGFLDKLGTKQPVRVLALAAPMTGKLTPFQEMIQRHGGKRWAHFEEWNTDLFVFELQPEVP